MFSSNEQVQQVEVIGRLLETKLKTLEEIDQEVLSLCNDDKIPQEIEESEKYLENVISCQKQINYISQQNGKPQETDPLAELIQTLPGAIAPSIPTNQVKAKLPKLVLPKFITTWMGFWDSFKSAVHDNASLTKINKFNHLRPLLEGAATRAIPRLALSSKNYDSVLEILEQRFGKTQQIISAHMEEILKLQPCLTDHPSFL